MKQERILDALTGVETAYILDAAPRQTTRRSRAGIWLGLAACLALAVISVYGLVSRHRLSAPQHQEPALNPVQMEGLSPLDTADDGPKSGPGENSYYRENTNTDRETILAYRFGELYLGMPQEDVVGLLGQPNDRSNSGPVTDEDGITREMWSYHLADDENISIDFADAGDGWVINEIYLWADCRLSLPHGIRIGMTEEELLAAWPELGTDFLIEHDGDLTDGNSLSPSYTLYSQLADELRFSVYVENGVVDSLSMGPFYDYPSIDLNEPDPPAPYDFAGGEITVWQRTDVGWQAAQTEGKSAKQIETIFSIEELKPLAEDAGAPQYVVDFHNGTVAVVCDEDERGAVYQLNDRAAFEASLAQGTAPAGLTQLVACSFPYGVWSVLEALFPA